MRRITSILVALILIMILANCSSRKHPTSPRLEPLVINALAMPETVYVGQSCALIGQAEGGIKPYLWEWQYNGSLFSVSKDTAFIPNSLGTYPFILKVMSADNQFGSDTVFVTAIKIPVDTVIIDTTIIDTVVVDTTKYLCATIGGSAHEILWLLMNDAGNYQLEFEATTERGQPPTTLVLDINGEIYKWALENGNTYTKTVFLKKSSQIKITKDPPKSHGNETTVCATITKFP